MSGEAKRRGTYEERVEQSKLRDTDTEFSAALQSIKDKKDYETKSYVLKKYLNKNSYSYYDERYNIHTSEKYVKLWDEILESVEAKTTLIKPEISI